MTFNNILTVDVEDWYHICGVKKYIPQKIWPELESRVRGNILKILDILDKKQSKATFFSLGYIAEKDPDLLMTILSAGHEIGTHGYAHKRVYTLTPNEFKNDLQKSLDIISGITGCPVKGFRAPEWSIRDNSLWALKIIKKLGMVYDSSMAPLPIIGNQMYPKRPFQHNPEHGSIWEFPPLVGSSLFGNLPIGGGWGLRVFPYSMVRSAIEKLNKENQPALVYVHPREFDPDPPSIRIPMIKKFVVSARISTTEKRLCRLLDDFEFTTVETVLGEGIRADRCVED